MIGDFAADGVAIFRQVVGQSLIAALRDHFEAYGPAGPGVRGFSLPSNVKHFIDGNLAGHATQLAALPMRAVRVLLFDKSPRSNWSVPWHQDRTIAVKARHDVPGFGPWSTKEGVVHVEPPVSVLENMLTLRVFVDDCDCSNGPLEIAKGSHRMGRVAAKEVRAIVDASEIVVATGQTADILAMRLLTIHSSKKADSPEHRRVLHVDYASGNLPKPLEWAVCV